MPTITEIEKLAFDLPEAQRAVLAAHLLGSLQSVLHDEDAGIAEALRRDSEFDDNPEIGISLQKLDERGYLGTEAIFGSDLQHCSPRGRIRLANPTGIECKL